jgi:hypothetical protein
MRGPRTSRLLQSPGHGSKNVPCHGTANSSNGIGQFSALARQVGMTFARPANLCGHVERSARGTGGVTAYPS